MHTTSNLIDKYSPLFRLLLFCFCLSILLYTPDIMAQGWKKTKDKKKPATPTLPSFGDDLNIEGTEPMMDFSSSPTPVPPVGEEGKDKDPDPPRNYTASPEFFNLEGTWESESSDSRFAKLDIFATIMGKYRARPYVKLGGFEMAYPKVIPLQASETDLAYITEMTGAQSWIMPRIVNGEEVLKVYTFVTDVTGQTTGMVTDILTRVGMPVRASTGTGSFRPSGDDLVDHWKNEWEKGQRVPRFRILKNVSSNQLNVRADFIDDGRLLKKEDQALIYDPVQGHYKAKFEEGGIATNLLLRPLKYGANSRTQGLELIVEELYGDNSPVQVYRQFFVRDPDAEDIEETEKLGKSLEGTWTNYDERGRLLEVVIQDGEAEVRVKCKGKANRKCSLGTQALEKISENVVGVTIDGVFYIRTIEFDMDLASNYTNGELANNPQNIVINATLKHKGGMEEDKRYSEVFKRKTRPSIFPEKSVEKSTTTESKPNLPWVSKQNKKKSSGSKWGKD